MGTGLGLIRYGKSPQPYDGEGALYKPSSGPLDSLVLFRFSFSFFFFDSFHPPSSSPGLSFPASPASLLWW